MPVNLARLFILTKPCNDCPFLVEGGVRLHPESALDILQAIERDKCIFPCHNTVDYDNVDGETDTSNSAYCAGAMIYLQHQGRPHQGMVAGMMFNMFDPDALDMDAPVFRSPFGFLRAQIKANAGRRWRGRVDASSYSRGEAELGHALHIQRVTEGQARRTLAPRSGVTRRGPRRSQSAPQGPHAKLAQRFTTKEAAVSQSVTTRRHGDVSRRLTTREGER